MVLGGLHKPCSLELCVINSSASHSYLKTIPTLHLFFSPPLSLIFSDPYFSPQQNYTQSEFSPYFPKPCHFTPQCLGLGELLFSRQQALCKLMSITGQKVQQGKPSTGTFLLTPPAPIPLRLLIPNPHPEKERKKKSNPPKEALLRGKRSSGFSVQLVQWMCKWHFQNYSVSPMTI